MRSLTHRRRRRRRAGVFASLGALVAMLVASVGAAPAQAAATQTQTAWIPLHCALLGQIPVHVAATLTGTAPTQVAPGGQFNLTGVRTEIVFPPPSQQAGAIFGANAIQGIVQDFEEHLVNAQTNFAAAVSTNGTPVTSNGLTADVQFNSVAAVQPPNQAATGNARINGGDTTRGGFLPATPLDSFSFGDIPSDSGGLSGTAFGPAPGTGGGFNDPNAGTPDILPPIGPMTATGAAGQVILLSNTNPNGTPIGVVGADTLGPKVADNTISFHTTTNTYTGQLPADCALDVSAAQIPSPDPNFVSHFEIPIVPTPTVTVLNPTHGAAAGGNTVTITGTDFTNVTSVQFGANAATTFTVNSPTAITATAPAGTAGNTVDVTVTTPSGTSPAAGAGNDYTYDAANQAPTANAGTDQSVNEGASVSLDGTGSSDPDGDTLTYAWTQQSGPSVTLSGANTATPSFTAPQVGPAGADLTFQLTVNDGHGGTATDTVTVHVSNVNQAPTANAGGDQTVNEGANVSLNGNGSSDPDGDTLTYAWIQQSGPSVTLSGANTATPSFTAPQVGPAGADLTFQLTVNDGNGGTATDTVMVHVNNVNQAPTANAGTDQTVNEGAPVSLDGTGSSDPDGTIASYAWTQTSGPAVTLTGADTATPSFTAPQVAANTDLVFQLQVTDNEGATGTDSVTIHVQNVVLPVIDASGAVSMSGPLKAGATTKKYKIKVSNIGNQPITIDPTEGTGLITGSVTVNGVANGSVVSDSTRPKTIAPGRSTTFTLVWTGGPLVSTDNVVFTGCVNVASDIDTTNDCASLTRIIS
jgi:hypothetical protein